MLEVRQVSSEELPEEARIFLDIDSPIDYSTYLLVYHNDELVRCESDSMEPEDAVFYRDLAWVSSAITEAYYMGKEDSKKI
jgi:hypothetical protein